MQRFVDTRRRARRALSAAAAAAGAPPPPALPPSARVVVIGGGVIGSSVAYHLSKLGWSDVVLLEQAKLTSGTTWHAAGLVGVMRANSNETLLAAEGARLYAALEAETGLSAGYKRCGSVNVARTQDRLTALRRGQAKAASYGIQVDMISPEEAGARWGGTLLRTDDVVGATWVPGDGTISPTDVTMSLAAGARGRGVRILEGVRATGFGSVAAARHGAPRVTAVHTSAGVINCEYVALCGGQWSRHLAATAGVSVPLHSAEHFYVVTKELPGVDSSLPVLRDPDGSLYVREWGSSLLVGTFEHNAKPIFTDAVPADFAFSLLPDDYEHFAPWYERAIERIPCLGTAPIRQMVNGPESFTTDNAYILGEAPEMRNFFVAAGFNSSGIASAGGAGKALAEWMVSGAPTMDLWPIDIRRFGPFHANPAFLRARVIESMGVHYMIPWPRRELTTRRGMRTSPFYAATAARCAVFGQKFGWERPLYFAADAAERAPAPTFGRPGWHAAAAREHLHTRAAVSLFDQSSFAKFAVSGRDAVAVMDRLCGARMDVPVGRVVYTPMLNARGGYESDVTVTRTGEASYFVVSGSSQATRDADWMRRNVHEGEDVAVADVTSAYCVLGLMGPRARELLSRVSSSDLSNAGFPFSTSREVDVGGRSVTAKRVTYVGELGWELYVPVEFGAGVAEAIRGAADAAGAPGGIELRDAGYYALDSLRVEKGYRAWGADLTPDHTPIEAGLMFAVDMTKPAFNGRDALLAAARAPRRRRLFNFVLRGSAAALWGDEPITLDGAIVGWVTSAGFGHSVGAPVAMGYVTHPEVGAPGFAARAGFAVLVDGASVPAEAALRAAYDPTSARVKA